MKVQQTIQRVSNGPGGHYVVGATRNATDMAQFKLLFREVGSITRLLNFLTFNHPMSHTQCHVQHALSTTHCLIFNHNETRLLYFMLEWQNPYSKVVLTEMWQQAC